MFLIQSTRKESVSREYGQLAPILDGITPIMTVFAKDNKADVKMTCLRLVESKANQTVDVPPQQGSAPSLTSPTVFLSALFAVTYFLVL